MKKPDCVTPQALTCYLDEQQRAAILSWLADPFGNRVKVFSVNLPVGSSVEDRGKLTAWDGKPYPVCLTIHEFKVSKAVIGRASRLPDGGVAYSNGKWEWGHGHESGTAQDRQRQR